MKMILSALLVVAVISVPCTASAQKTVCDPWGNCITIPPHTNPGSDVSMQQQRRRGPSQKELDERARAEEAHRLNEEGVAAWNRGEWTFALELFRRAGGQQKGNKTIHANWLAALYKVMQDDIEKGQWEYASNNCQSALLYEPKLKELKRLCAIVAPKVAEQRARVQAERADNRAFNRANDLGKLGKASFERGDYVSAEAQYLEAARIYPGELAWMHNVATCRTHLGDRAKDAGLRELNDDIALEHYRSAAAYYRRALEANPQNQYALTTMPRMESLIESYEQHKRDEIAEAARKAQLNRDAMLVDARNLPSGLPADQERAIAAAYRNSPPGVIERVERGFQAVNKHDWALAQAWFGDALRRDPYNVGLRNLVTLAAYPGTGTQLTTKPPVTPVVPQSFPGKADVEAFFSDFREGRPSPSRDAVRRDAVRRYVRSLTNDEFKRMLWDLQPQPADLDYLFNLIVR